MNRLRPGIASTLFALATLLAAPAVPAAALSADCGPPPAGAMCLDGPWFEFATMKIDLAQGEVRSRYEVTVGAGRDLKVSLEESSPYRRGRADAILIDGEVLATNTPSRSSYYGPPWTVEGSVTPTGKREYAFDLTFSFRLAQPDGTVTAREHKHRYTGRASYPAKRPRIPDATSLVGWKLDSPSREAPAFKSLGEARRALGVAPPK